MCFAVAVKIFRLGFKASKTLSGIETEGFVGAGGDWWASKPLKPFQGLKLINSI